MRAMYINLIAPLRLPLFKDGEQILTHRRLSCCGVTQPSPFASRSPAAGPTSRSMRILGGRISSNEVSYVHWQGIIGSRPSCMYKTTTSSSTSARPCPSRRSLPSSRRPPSPRRRPEEFMSAVSEMHPSSRLLRTSSSWPGKSIARFPLRAFHTFRVQSLLPVTRSLLSADHAH